MAFQEIKLGRGQQMALAAKEEVVKLSIFKSSLVTKVVGNGCYGEREKRND